MKLYHEKWALATVNDWEKSNPRVKAFIDKAETWARMLDINMPRIWVKMRLAYYLRRSSGDTSWRHIKGMIENPINDRPIFTEYLIPPRSKVLSEEFERVTSYQFEFDV